MINKLDMINLLHSIYIVQNQINELPGNKVSTKFKNVQSDLRDIVAYLEGKIKVIQE